MVISQISQPRLKGYRFPRSVVSYAVWAYHRFALSLRDVEDLLAERGIVVSYETIRAWVEKFGTQIAKQVRTVRRQPSDKWHLDEVVTSGNRDRQAAQLRRGSAQAALGVDHRAHKGLNNRIEGPHRPTRKREKIQGQFKSARQVQRFLRVHDETANLFRPRRHKMTASTYRQTRTAVFNSWNEYNEYAGTLAV